MKKFFAVLVLLLVGEGGCSGTSMLGITTPPSNTTLPPTTALLPTITLPPTTALPPTTTPPSTTTLQTTTLPLTTTPPSTATLPPITTLPPTTPPPQTTPTPKMSWKVMDGNNTCQVMWFSQNITISYYNTTGMRTDVKVLVPIEDPLLNVSGDCSSMEMRTFAMSFFPDGNSSADPWTLRFVFKIVESDTFQLTSLSFELKYDNHFDSTNEGQFVYIFSSTEDPLGGIKAPMKKSFSCPSQPISSADEKYGLSIVVEDVKLQPFADKTVGQFGESVLCPYVPVVPTSKTPEQNHTWRAATFVVSAIFVVFFLGTVGCYYYNKKKRVPATDHIGLIQDY